MKLWIFDYELRFKETNFEHFPEKKSLKLVE